MKWIEKYIRLVEGFPRPDWGEINEVIEQDFSDQNLDNLWCDISSYWVNQIKEVLPNGYVVYETTNFILLTSESKHYADTLLDLLERSLKSMLKTLPGIADDSGYGKHVVLIIDDQEKYYSYISYFYPDEGEYASSAGVYLNKGYGHFVFAHQDIAYAESIAVHELCHALLDHIPIPLWLNEGIAVNIENMLIGSQSFTMDHEKIMEHRQYWDIEKIQEYWSGESFSRPDEGCDLSYSLAQFMVYSLSKDYQPFKEFVNQANYKNGGEDAAQKIFNNSLGYLIEGLLGEGEWSPIKN